MNTTLQVRIDNRTKNKVKKILSNLGLDFSSAIKLYFRQIEKNEGIPFRLVTENGFTPEREKEILRESNEMMRLRKQGKLKTFASVDELFADALE